MTRFSTPPVEYLKECSNTSLRYFEMSKLEHAANLRRELTVLLDEMMEETALALLARWMLDRRSSREGNGIVPGESRGRGACAAKKLLAGWLSSTRQVESGAQAPGPGSGKARGPAPAVISPGRAEAPQHAPALPAARGESDPPVAAGRTDRRIERKGARGLRAALRASGTLPGPAKP